MKIIKLLLLLLFMQPAFAVEASQPLSSFINKGQTVEQKIIGELNADPYQDVVLLLKNPKSPSLRTIVILLGTEKADSFQLLGKNTQLQPCATCIGNMNKLGMTQATVTMETGKLNVHWQLPDKRQILEVLLTFHYDKALNKLLLVHELRARNDLLGQSRDEIILDYIAGTRTINGEAQPVAIKPEAIDTLQCE